MSRYCDCCDDVIEIYDSIIRFYFPVLLNCKIKLIFDTKKRTSGGKVVLASIKKSNDLIRHLTDNECEDGYDFIMTIDQNAWENIDDVDRKRIIRHELRHIDIDLDSAKNPYKIIDHTITDFYEEVELNQDDPRWAERVVSLVAEIYEQKLDDK